MTIGTAMAAEGGAMPRRHDRAELEARLRDATRHGGDLKRVLEALVEDLSTDEQRRLIALAVEELQLTFAAARRAHDIGLELQDLEADGPHPWDAAHLLDELADTLTRVLR